MYNDRVSIQDIQGNIKRLMTDSELFLAVLLLLIAVVSFGLGRMSVVSSVVASAEGRVSPQSGTVIDASTERASATPASGTVEEGAYVASKNGTKYHLPWCGSASRIKDENKVWFDTKEAAEAAGYGPAANCEGL